MTSLLAALAVALAVLLMWPPPELLEARDLPVAPTAVVGLAALVVAWVALPPLAAAPLVVLAPAAMAARLLWRRRQEAKEAETRGTRTVEVCDLLADCVRAAVVRRPVRRRKMVCRLPKFSVSSTPMW